MTTVEARISGIPCLIEVTHYLKVRGSGSWNAPSDMDYHGYEEINFEVCDRRGRQAPWLERKMTKDDIREIERLICEAMQEARDDY
jgi:hypothetical protein